MRLPRSRGESSGGAACSRLFKTHFYSCKFDHSYKINKRKHVGEMYLSFDLSLKSGFLAGFPGISVQRTWQYLTLFWQFSRCAPGFILAALYLCSHTCTWTWIKCPGLKLCLWWFSPSLWYRGAPWQGGGRCLARSKSCFPGCPTDILVNIPLLAQRCTNIELYKY